MNIIWYRADFVGPLCGSICTTGQKCIGQIIYCWFCRSGSKTSCKCVSDTFKFLGSVYCIAYSITKACRSGEVILHSDQGSQFTSLEFILHYQNLGITQSMSNAACSYDNAAKERYYNTLLIYQYIFDTASDLDLDVAVFEFAFGWYNQVRPHAHDGYKTPFEKRYSLG